MAEDWHFFISCVKSYRYNETAKRRREEEKERTLKLQAKKVLAYLTASQTCTWSIYHHLRRYIIFFEMGASNSNTANSNTVTAVPAGSLLSQPGFRVKVTRDGKELNSGGAVMDPVEKAYQRGKEEGHAAIHTALDSVAAQVYDNIHEQLLSIQKQNLEKSEQMVWKMSNSVSAVGS